MASDKAVRVNGQLYLKVTVPNRGFTQQGATNMKPHTLWVPVGESPNDLGKPMIVDNRAAASSSSGDPRFYTFDIDSKNVETPKSDPTQVRGDAIRLLAKETPTKTQGELEAEVKANENPDTPVTETQEGYPVRSETDDTNAQIERDRAQLEKKKAAEQRALEAKSDQRGRTISRLMKTGLAAGAGYVADQVLNEGRLTNAIFNPSDVDTDNLETQEGLSNMPATVTAPPAPEQTNEEKVLELMSKRKRPLLNYSSQKPMRGVSQRSFR